MRTSKLIICFVAVVLCINGLLSFILIPSSIVRVLLHEVQNKEEQYELLILGQSHGETNYDPFYLESETGMKSYNLSRRQMMVDDIYYMLLEGCKTNKVRYVILDMDPEYWQGDNTKNYFCDSYMLRHIKNPIDKIRYLMNGDILNDFRIPLFPYMDITTGIQSIGTTVNDKFSKEYWSYSIEATEPVNKAYTYIGRGFRYGNERNDTGSLGNVWDANNVNQASISGFKDIVTYCNKNDIKLICISSPLPACMREEGNYVGANEFFANMCEEHGVAFYDYNIGYGSGLSYDDMEFVDSDGHMLGEFAERYTKEVSIIVNSYDKLE